MFTQLLRRAAGALVHPNGLDGYVQLVAPTWSEDEVRGRIVGVDHGTADSVTLTIEPNRNWMGFIAGQYTQLSVDVDGVRHTRCYSMATSAHRAGTFELTVKAHPQGTVSRYLKANAAVGMVVGLSPAAGAFVLPAVRNGRIILMSGGSGVTPVMAMLRTLCDEQYAGPVTFVHYALTEADMIYRSEVAALAAAHPNVRVVRIFTDAPGTGDLDGFLTLEQLDAIEPEWRDATTFVCGPAPLMDAAGAIFDTEGRTDRLHTEAFTLATFVAEAGSIDGALRFDRAGLVLANDGRTILEQAEAAGLAPASGCRMGICGTCTRSLTCGTVRDAATGALTSGTDVAVRICVSVPVGDTAIDL